jgi:hypothetical protein
MPKTPRQVGSEARYENFPKQIVPRSIPKSQVPPLPPHLDTLLDQEWSPETNRQIDFWILYCDLEFGGVQ